MMAVYYSDPWGYYGQVMMDANNADEAVEQEHGELFQLEDPPFGPISEEGEEEMGEMKSSFSDTSVTTTTPSTFKDLKSTSKLISRHHSLEGIPKIRRVLDHSFSYPLLVAFTSNDILLPKVPRDMPNFVRCEILSPLKGGLHLKPMLVCREVSLQRVQVDDPPEILVDTPLQRVYANANWNQNSPNEEESVRIIVADADEEEDEDEDGESIFEDREAKAEVTVGFSQIRRCRHFENINQLTATGGSPLYPVMEEENGLESDLCLNSPIISDGQTIHRWGREISQIAPSVLDTTSSFSLTPYAADQVLIKQEEQLWASLFAPSESAVVKSAMGFTAQLQEMSQLVEVAADEVMKGLYSTNVDGKEQDLVDNTDVTSPKEPLSSAIAFNELHSPQSGFASNQDANEWVESQGGRIQPSLPRQKIDEASANLDATTTTTTVEESTSNSVVSIACTTPTYGQARQSPIARESGATDTPARPDTPRVGVTDIPRETGYRLVGGGRVKPMAYGEAHEVEGVEDSSHGCSRNENSSSAHRPKVVSPPPPHPPPAPPPLSPPPSSTTHYPTGEGCNVLLLPKALVHHSSRLPQQLQQQQTEAVTLSGEEEPLSLITEAVRSQSVDHLPLLLLESPSSPEVQSTQSRTIGSCLWSALCKNKSRQFDRAIRTLTASSEGSTSFLESTDALLSLLKSETEPTEVQHRVVAKTRRLHLTQICNTTIEEREEQCSFLPPSERERRFEFTTAQHLFSSLTYENPLLVSMTSALRGKRSQSYIARSEFDTSYARQQQQQQQQQHAQLRLPDVPPHGTSANHRKHRSFTLSSMPHTATTSQRYGENDMCFASMWSPPLDKSISAGLSPKHARIKSSQYSSRPLASKDNFTLSSSGFTSHRSAPNGSYQRVNRYSGSMLDEYGSGDSGGSNSSYRKRFIDQRKSTKTPSSARMSGDASIMRLGYDTALANRSSTLPYKRRGSWHVDREANFSTLDWNTSRNLWSKSRWRSFSPERLALETSHDTGPPPLSSESRSLRSQSLHRKHLLELTKSTEQLSTGFLDNYKGIETSFNTLRAKLDAASTDRLYGRDATAEQLRRQCKREHRRLLKSLMSDSWEKGIERQPNPPPQYFNQAPGVVLPVQEATLLTAPRTTNPLTNPNLEKLLRNPTLMQLLANHASQAHQTPDQNSLADQVTLAAVAGAAAATAMANFATPSTEQPSYSNLPVQTTSTGDEYDWNDPETLMAAYTALAEASGGEKAFLEQLSPELAATLVHYREQLSEKLSAGESGSGGKVNSVTSAVTTTTATPTTSVPSAAMMTPSSGAVYKGGGGSQSAVVLEDVSRQPGMDKETIVPSGRIKLSNASLNDAASRIRGMNRNSDSTPTKLLRRTYDFPTKRLLLMRSSKGRNMGGNGFGLEIVGGRQRSDGRLGSYVEQIHSGETLGYLHGEISEGDEVIEWNGIPLIGKGAAEVQAIVDTPADEVELLVRINPSETLASHRYPQEFLQHTCSRRSPCTADAHRYPPKLCPSHNPNPHFHESLHGSGGGGGSCVHQQHICQQSQQSPRGPPIHTCEVHPTGPACIHKQQQHMCRSGDWSSDPRGTCPSRGVIDQPPPNSPQSERNISETSASPSTRTGSVHHHQRQVVPTVNVAEYDGGGREAPDAVSHSSGGPINGDGHLVTDEGVTPSFGEIELILTFDDYDQSLTAHVARARGLRPMDLNGLADPFVKLRLHPDPTEDVDLNRQIKYIPNTLEPEWQQTVVFMNCLKRTLKKRVLEATVWDFDRLKMNDFMGQAIIHLGSKEALDGQPHWYKLHALQDIVIPGYRQPGQDYQACERDQSSSNKEYPERSKSLANGQGNQLRSCKIA
uniref:Protein piccolo n=1 Tax=Echinococcus granulosus TaxID=6210 RepID=A0A068WC08_ECHGR|nr:protein piccolo [Echinococcus granulosus]